MQITLELGVLKIGLSQALECLNTDEKRSVADALACEDDIIKDVVAQLINGWTEAGSHGVKLCHGYAEPNTGLDWAWREIAKRSGEIAAKEIKRLEDALKAKTDELQKLRDEYSRRHF